MLYVFFVDIGSMMELEMDVALETVVYLKKTLTRICRVPADKQVLLISGGEALEENEKVCKYNAGTDTSPIFLFSLTNLENDSPPVIPHVNMDASDEQLEMRAETSLTLPVAQTTVSVRASIAQDYVKASSEQVRLCETLIHDQHLQHQGWQAVVANLEDTGIDLDRKKESMRKMFRKYLAQREEFREMIENFDEDIATLHRIPVLPSLLEAESSESMIGSIIHNERAHDKHPQEHISLLDWINSRGSSITLEQLADGCFRSIESLSDDLLEDLMTEVTGTIENSRSTKMKEIRGLSDRLQSLEQILTEAKKRLQEQMKMGQAFVQNQQRASGLKDDSILPDLCDSHKEQLRVMSQNYQQITSMRKRIEKAKDELSANLHHRMRWVVSIQDQMADKMQLMVMYHQELKRLQQKMEVIEQLHAAPSIYIASSVEVVRRRAFSDHFLNRANQVSDKFRDTYQNEVHLRQTFLAKLKKHFLSKMFPGLDDFPPAFATERPKVFDNRLPKITLSDVELLRKEFPDLAKSLQIPDEGALANLMARSINQALSKEEDETRNTLQNIPNKIHITSNDIGSMSVMQKLIVGSPEGYHRKRLPRKFSRAVEDSETDTDECEATRRWGKGSSNGGRPNILTKSLPLDDDSLSGQGQDANTVKHAESFEFKVDKSIDPSCSSADPSSSSGGGTGNNSSVAPSSSSDGSVVKHNETTNLSICKEKVDQSQNTSTVMITTSSSVISEGETSLARLRELMQKCLSGQVSNSLIDMKTQIGVLREQISEETESFEKGLNDIKMFVNRQAELLLQKEKELDAIGINDMKKENEELKEQLDLERNKLEDCNREIEIYLQQLQSASLAIDRHKEEMSDAKEAFEKRIDEMKCQHAKEKDEMVQKMTLEHELELESVKESLSETERVAELESEVERLKKELSEQHELVDDLRRKTRILENTQEERFHMEKEKIVQILEAGFSQRERLAVQKLEETLTRKHEEEIMELQKKHEDVLAQVSEAESERVKNESSEEMAQLKENHREEVQKLQESVETQIRQAVLKERKLWDIEKDREIKMLKDRLSQKAKIEVEGLRTRFKMMQNAGALDRSPSASESDVSLGSPKTDIIENIRSTMMLENENNLRAERLKYDEKVETMQAEIEDLRGKLRIKDTGERQVQFNEALKKAVDEKEKELKVLHDKVNSFENVMSQLRVLFGASESDNNFDIVQAVNNAVCESNKQRQENPMSASVIRVPSQVDVVSDTTVEALQKENSDLRNQMTKSMHSEMASDQLTTTSVSVGDHVMIIWSENNGQFKIFNENNMHYFLHTDSLEALGLSVTQGVPNKKHATGEVIDKEFCQAKKPQNRFKVPQGTKFYRVKCKQIAKKKK